MNTVPIVADNNILLPMGPRVLRKRANIAFLSADKHLLSSDKQRTLQFPVSLQVMSSERTFTSAATAKQPNTVSDVSL